MQFLLERNLLDLLCPWQKNILLSSALQGKEGGHGLCSWDFQPAPWTEVSKIQADIRNNYWRKNLHFHHCGSALGMQ